MQLLPPGSPVASTDPIGRKQAAFFPLQGNGFKNEDCTLKKLTLTLQQVLVIVLHKGIFRKPANQAPGHLRNSRTG